MAEENEIIAIFRADIEQFKAQMAELQRTIKGVDAPLTALVDRFGNPFRKAVDDSTSATDKFGKSTKTAHGSISVLSKGLGGVAGLLGITGRLFGVNTDKIEALVFASKEFIKVGREITHVQHLSNVATSAGTTAKVANEGATVSLTVAERILNAVRAAGAVGVGLVVAGVVALGAAIYSYVQGLNDEEKALKRKAAIDKEQIKINNQLTESLDKRIETQTENALNSGVTNKIITQRQAEEIALRDKNIDRQIEINKEIEAERLKAALAGGDKFGRLTNEDNIRIEANRKKLLEGAEQDLQTGLDTIRVKFEKEAAHKAEEEAKKRALADAENKKAGEQAWIDYLEDIRQINQKGFHQTQVDEAEILKKRIELQKEGFKELQDAQEKFTTFRIASLTGHDKDEQKIALEAIRTRKKLGTATEAELDALDNFEEKINAKRVEQAKEVSDAIFKAQQEAFDKRQDLLKEEQTQQEKAIEVQRGLAERGLENTLAFEQKRSAELQRQQQKEAQQQKRVKLLETFLNSLAEYSKTDPDKALSKALLQVALATAASAVFAEEGGVIGEIGSRSNLSRRHKGGGDVLLHAQTGEGVLPRDAMSAIGRRNFELLKNAGRHPIKDNIYGLPNISMGGSAVISNAEVVKELKALQHIVKNKKESHWDVNKFGEYISTSIENGVTEITKGKLKKPRFKNG